jgi:hypothetical protein
MFNKGNGFGFQQFTVTNATASGLTIPVPQCEAALIRTENQNLRFRVDGTAPTSAVGYPIYSSDTTGFWLWGAGILKNFQCVATSGTATVDVMYFGLAE